MIVKVNKENLQIAAEINAESWQNSHSTLYSESFINLIIHEPNRFENLTEWDEGISV